jgi:hypothetical protein
VFHEATTTDGARIEQSAKRTSSAHLVDCQSIGSPETYRLLVIDRGWSRSRFERWYGDTLGLLLLPRPATAGRRE